MLITANLLAEWGACWSEDDIAEAAERFVGDGASPAEVAADENISLDDRLWAVSKALWHTNASKARLCAIESAELVEHLAGNDSDRATYRALMVELRRIEAEVPEADRAAARDAARAAARDAARDAAWAAAWDAAWAAAWAAELRKAIARCLVWLGDDANR